MKRFIILSLSTALLAGGMASCSSSESVVSNGFLQKRKYNKGFHKNVRKNIKSNEKDQEELVLEVETVNPTKEVKIKNPTTNKVDIALLVASMNESNLVEKNTNNSIIKTERASEFITEVTNEDKHVNVLKNSSKKLVNPIFKNSNTSSVSNTQDFNVLLLYILCFFIPFLAVGIATDWNIGTVLINLLLCLLFFLPGIIHALIVVSRNT